VKGIKNIITFIRLNKAYILGVFKLVFSIVGCLLFALNSDIAHHLYPDYKKEWAVFMPMNDLRYNFFSGIIFCYAFCASVKTVFKIGDVFLYSGLFLSLFDVLDRQFFHITERIELDFIITIPCSILFATLIYVETNRNRKINP